MWLVFLPMITLVAVTHAIYVFVQEFVMEVLELNFNRIKRKRRTCIPCLLYTLMIVVRVLSFCFIVMLTVILTPFMIFVGYYLHVRTLAIYRRRFYYLLYREREKHIFNLNNSDENYEF